MTTILMPTPEALKTFRAKHSLTTEELAELLGVSTGDLARHMNPMIEANLCVTAAEPIRVAAGRMGLSILLMHPEDVADLTESLKTRVIVHISA